MNKIFVFTIVAAAGCAKSPLDADPRLARLEHRLDKVVAALDQALPPADADPAQTYAMPVGESDPIEGPRDARVTIVEGYDFLCPYCFMVNPVIEQVRAKHPNDVRVVSKYYVIHGQPAVAAAMYACSAARQGKFTEMKQALWGNLFAMEGGQPRAHAEAVAKLDEMAAQVGVDPARVAADSEACRGWVTTSQRELAAFGVHATPAIFINGRPVRDRSPENLDRLVTEELAKAEHSDVARADYYDKEIVGKGLRKVKGRFDD